MVAAQILLNAALTRALVTAVACAAALPAPTQDVAPPIPDRDFADARSYAVQRINERGTVELSLAGQDVEVQLLGVAPPAQGAPTEHLRRFLEDLLLGENVYIEFGAGGQRSTPAGVATVYLYRAPDGLFVNLETVRQAAANVDDASAHAHAELFRYYRQRARATAKGVWRPENRAGPAERTRRPTTRRSSAEPPATRADIVYVTKTGKKYHLAGCQHLRKSASPLPLEKARQTHEPCSRCKPPP
jgi:micrococcal nuclease